MGIYFMKRTFLFKLFLIASFSSLLSACVQTTTTPHNEVAVNHMDYNAFLTEDKKAVVFVGSIKSSAAAALKELVNLSPDVEALIIMSFGGNIGTAKKMSAILDKNNMDVYAYDLCLSACVLVFAGSDKRYLGDGAKLGFHSASFSISAYKNDPTLSRHIRSANLRDELFLIRHGVSESFAKKTNEPKSSEMWFPENGELLKANMITEALDSNSVIYNYTDSLRLKKMVSKYKSRFR